MTIFIISFVVIIAAVAAMAIGVIFGRDAIKGSCGGIGAIDGAERACGCAEPCEKLKRHRARQRSRYVEIR